MDNNINHILNVTGILRNFSIVKRISPSELNKIKKRVSSTSISSEEYNRLLKLEIIKYTDEYVKKNQIPGLIINHLGGLKKFTMRNTEYMSIYKDAIEISRNLKDVKKLNKAELLFFIVSMICYLGLSEKDFKDFNAGIQEKSKESFDNGNYDDEEYDDEEYDDDDDDDDDGEIV